MVLEGRGGGSDLQTPCEGDDWSGGEAYAETLASESEAPTRHYYVNHGGFTPCQFEDYVWTKFTTPILHPIDNFKNCDIFSTYI